MTSETRETSWDSGQPVAFFRFTRGTRTWYYTSSDRAEELLGEIYLPAAISRSAIKQGSERAKLSIKVTLPSSLDVAKNWRPYPPAQPIALTCFVRHVGESEALVEWVGRVTSSSFDGAELVLTCEPSQTRSRRPGAQRCWQRGCGLVLYSQGMGKCNLDPEAVPVAATLTAVDGTQLTAVEFTTAPRSLAGGRLAWIDDLEVPQQRNIVAHAADTITLDEAAPDLAIDLAVTAYTAPLYRSATVTAVSGLTLSAPEFGLFPSGRLAGGYIEWLRVDGLAELRSIRAHSGNSIVVDYGAADLAADLVLTAYPGCAHTWTDCSYFENQSNYGGDLWMPTKNPFDGNPVW